MNETATLIRRSGAAQQPDWPDPAQLRRVQDTLVARPPLVGAEDVEALRSLLADVACGQAHVVQAGDCAEHPDECTAAHVLGKAAVLDLLAGTLQVATRKPVVRVGRMAGQFAKPRSRPTERVGDVELPAYRGHMVNGPDPDPDSRRPDPLRLLTGYMAAAEVVGQLGWRRIGAVRRQPDAPVWLSHEALLLDYELPMVRTRPDGRPWLASTHWPWVGERTRQVDGPHVALLAEIANPVACKVGPAMTTDEIVRLCQRLDPDREPGRLTLVARMGADVVEDRLPSLVAAVRAEGHPVIWLCDPMHGNTTVTSDGQKTRSVATVTSEAVRFRAAVTDTGGVAGGLHLETTPEDVTECVDPATESMPHRYTTLCDPRLNPAQAVAVVAAWAA